MTKLFSFSRPTRDDRLTGGSGQAVGFRECCNETAITEVRTCETMEKLDDSLNKHGITDMRDTIDFLNKCMYDPQTFFSSKPNLDDELEFTKQMFLTGTWKINRYYERMKIKKAETVGAK